MSDGQINACSFILLEALSRARKRIRVGLPRMAGAEVGHADVRDWGVSLLKPVVPAVVLRQAGSV